jgi:hypothetical protein
MRVPLTPPPAALLPMRKVGVYTTVADGPSSSNVGPRIQTNVFAAT